MTPIQIVVARSCYTQSAQLTGLIALAEAQTSACAYGPFRSSAVAYLALHWMALAERGRGAAAGPVTSETEGDLSRSYAVAQASSQGGGGDDLQSTSWGLQLLRLRKGSFIAGGLTRLG